MPLLLTAIQSIDCSILCPYASGLGHHWSLRAALFNNRKPGFVWGPGVFKMPEEFNGTRDCYNCKEELQLCLFLSCVHGSLCWDNHVLESPIFSLFLSTQTCVVLHKKRRNQRLFSVFPHTNIGVKKRV